MYSQVITSYLCNVYNTGKLSSFHQTSTLLTRSMHVAHGMRIHVEHNSNDESAIHKIMELASRLSRSYVATGTSLSSFLSAVTFSDTFIFTRLPYVIWLSYKLVATLQISQESNGISMLFHFQKINAFPSRLGNGINC